MFATRRFWRLSWLPEQKRPEKAQIHEKSSCMGTEMVLYVLVLEWSLNWNHPGGFVVLAKLQRV